MPRKPATLLETLLENYYVRIQNRFTTVTSRRGKKNPLNYRRPVPVTDGQHIFLTVTNAKENKKYSRKHAYFSTYARDNTK